MRMTTRTKTARSTATMVKMTAMMAATSMAVARLVGRSMARSEACLAARSVAWLEAVFFAWRLYTLVNVKTCFGINLFWSKMVKMIFRTYGQVQQNLFYLYLFQVYSMFIPV